MPEDIRVGSPLGYLSVEDPDEPQNRMTQYSIVQGQFRDTFKIETDHTHNKGIIKPMKVCRPGATGTGVGLGAPSMPRTRTGAAPRPEATRGVVQAAVELAVCSRELGWGGRGGRVGALGWVTPKQTVRQGLGCK